MLTELAVASEYERYAHQDWIGLLQPVGLVVSPPALIAAQAVLDRNMSRQRREISALVARPVLETVEGAPRGASVPRSTRPVAWETFAVRVLGWKLGMLAGSLGGPDLSEEFSLILPEFGETLRPTYAVIGPPDDSAKCMMLVVDLADGTSFDDPMAGEAHMWNVSPEVRLERLLREKRVPIGILANGRSIRLVYAPRGESSGHITWPIDRLAAPVGRDMLSALCMLLGYERLYSAPTSQRLPQILRESRQYQNVVSTKLAGQVLVSLNELLRGFQAANESTHGALLDATVRDGGNHVYGGLLAVVLRLVFILYAEERGLLSSSTVYVRGYSLCGLFDELRTDAGRFPDAMDQRYGSWSRLLVLFRCVHDGVKRGSFRLPPRHGRLFDPDGWAFLEGRPFRVNRVKGARVDVPRVSDGVVLRVLENLLVLDGARLSYRALDVEQIGSVYENMMGFRLERASEVSIGVGKEHVVIGLQTLLNQEDTARERVLKSTAHIELRGKAVEALKRARSVEELVAALGRRISPLYLDRSTQAPRMVAEHGFYLQPTDERRRSGSHYTPRQLTEPIVRTALRPIFDDLGAAPNPSQILALKVCDPAMGSGAFLVEACRQIAEELLNSYDVHGRPADVSAEEDIVVYAQRQVAKHCLYGVDKNPFAVDLGKLSLWLATLARDHEFTFLDHSIRHGDSLIGLTRDQISSFHWAPDKRSDVIGAFVDKAIGDSMAWRAKFSEMVNSDDVGEKRRLLRNSDEALERVRMVGNAVLRCFFSSEHSKDREDVRSTCEAMLSHGLCGRKATAGAADIVARLPVGERCVTSFHWEVEFPEVFGMGGGFDAIVGNPPFLGGKRISTAYGKPLASWLTTRFSGATGNADLVAYFFRQAFILLRQGGTFGLVATKTIAEGDTRATGLRWLRQHGAEIYAATKRMRWPGTAAVVVSTVAIRKCAMAGQPFLNDRPVSRITAFLVHRGSDTDPERLGGPNTKSFIGCFLRGMGFTFDDSTEEATPIAQLERVRVARPEVSEIVRPYLGGEEVLHSPTHTPHRYVINFADLAEEQARSRWPELMAIVENKVKPARHRLGNSPVDRAHKEKWWLFANDRPELRRASRLLARVIAVPRVSSHLCAVFLPSDYVLSDQLVVFAFEEIQMFSLLQSRTHEVWARCFSSTMGEGLRYTPSDCFETFPLPRSWATDPELRAAGATYDDVRSSRMIRMNEGLTTTYLRFHNPHEIDPEILELRYLHAAMDQAVLAAYGWTDIQPTCEFLLDGEEDDEVESAEAGRLPKKKSCRYRWRDEVRDEVLARLLELNAQQSKDEIEEARASRCDRSQGVVRRASAKTKTSVPSGQGVLFGEKGE